MQKDPLVCGCYMVAPGDAPFGGPSEMRLEACAREASSLHAAGLALRRSTDKVVCWRLLRMQLSAGSFLDRVSGGGLVECSMGCRNCCVPEYLECFKEARPRERSSNRASLARVRAASLTAERSLGAARPRKRYCERELPEGPSDCGSTTRHAHCKGDCWGAL